MQKSHSIAFVRMLAGRRELVMGHAFTTCKRIGAAVLLISMLLSLNGCGKPAKQADSGNVGNIGK